MAKTFDKLFDVTGKTAIVTGGAGIQGPRVAAGLAAYGANVALVDVDEDGARVAAAQISDETGASTLAVECDVSKPDSVNAMIDRVVEVFGGVHILHNNAASKSKNVADFFAPFEDFKFETWREIMSVNVDGMFLVAQAVVRQMIAQKSGGSIIQTSSTYGLVGPEPRIYEGSKYLGETIRSPAAYSASKAAVVGLTRYLATHLAEHGIRVNTLVPGGIESGQNDTFVQSYSSRVPLGRMSHRDEMVGAVVFMASEASSYMTGQMVVVDGGWTVW